MEASHNYRPRFGTDDYWRKELQETTGKTLKLKRAIINKVAIEALAKVLPKDTVVDTTLCTFSKSAREALQEGAVRAISYPILTSVKIENCYSINKGRSTLFIKDPSAITVHFKQNPYSGNTPLDLTGTVFSADAWNALLQHLKDIPSIPALMADTLSIEQIEALFTLPMEALESLNLSRSPNLSTSSEEKEALNKILSKHLPKLTKLKELYLDNWYLEDQHLNFNNRLENQETVVTIQGHWIRRIEASSTLMFKPIETLDDVVTFPEDSFAVVLDNSDLPNLLIDSTDILQKLKKKEKTTLSLSGLSFTNTSWSTLLRTLSSEKHITSLEFVRCYLTPAMIKSLKSLTHLNKLNISANGEIVRKEKFCQSIQEVLQACQNLTHLYLESNLLTDDDLSLLFPEQSLRKLSLLSLRDNCLTRRGKQALESYISLPITGGKRKRDVEIEEKKCEIELKGNSLKQQPV